MHRIYFLLTFGLSIFLYSCRQVVPSTIDGRLTNTKDSMITISIGADPITGIAPTGYQEKCKINGDGLFSIPINRTPPVNVTLYNNDFRADLRMLKEGKLTFSADCENYPESSKFHGANSSLNTFLIIWNQFYQDAYKNIRGSIKSYSEYKNKLDSLQVISLRMLDDFNAKNILDIPVMLTPLVR